MLTGELPSGLSVTSFVCVLCPTTICRVILLHIVVALGKPPRLLIQLTVLQLATETPSSTNGKILQSIQIAKYGQNMGPLANRAVSYEPRF